jgi:hypothetical protein
LKRLQHAHITDIFCPEAEIEHHIKFAFWGHAILPVTATGIEIIEAIPDTILNYY